MELEHVFASTNRQPDSVFWIRPSYFVTCATKTLILHQVDHKNFHKIRDLKNVHKTDITRIGKIYNIKNNKKRYFNKFS